MFCFVLFCFMFNILNKCKREKVGGGGIGKRYGECMGRSGTNHYPEEYFFGKLVNKNEIRKIQKDLNLKNVYNPGDSKIKKYIFFKIFMDPYFHLQLLYTLYSHTVQCFLLLYFHLLHTPTKQVCFANI